jgi:SAM-dependent methyltransferase
MDAEAWNERYRAGELVWSTGPNQFVESELSGLPPGRALDLAAGEGRNAIWLARRGWQVTAVDFSQAGLDKGRILGEGLDIEWVCADATTWAREPAYDVCLVAYLQLVADERRAAVHRAYDSVRTGGTLLWISHDLSNHTEGVGGPTDPAVLMTAEDVLGDLAGRDLEVQRAGRVAREVPDGHREDSSATAWDCLVRVVRRD